MVVVVGNADQHAWADRRPVAMHTRERGDEAVVLQPLFPLFCGVWVGDGHAVSALQDRWSASFSDVNIS